MSIANRTEVSAHLEKIAVERFDETYNAYINGEADAEDVILSEQAVEVASNM